MKPALSQEYFEALACPSCQAKRLLLTKEKILICQTCLNGYKINGDVPDFRLENAISFKKKISSYKKGLKAVVTVLMGSNKNQSVDLKVGHCVVVGRMIQGDPNSDLTFVGKPTPATYTNLDPANHQIVERFMSKNTTTESAQSKREVLFEAHQRVLGNFVRNPDFLIQDPSVSRSHAVIYHEEKGVNILDLVSKNGTYVNGYEVEGSKIKNNDVISLGAASLRVNIY